MSNLSQQGKLAKAFTAMTSFATVLSMSGVMYLAPVTALAVAPADYGLTEGDVVSAAGSDDPDVYIVNELGYKRLFLNPAIFNFYGHLGGFAAVKNVSASTRDAFGTSGLFRNCETNDPKVYGVETTGEDTGMLHWVNTSGAQAVMDDANFFKKVFCINNNEFNWYPKGSDYTSVNQVPNYSRGSQTTPPPVSGPLSVGLASSNPVGGTIVNGQARYNLADFMFTGSATVTNLKLDRLGVSADATLTNVYLYDGARRLTDSATVSSGIITFNDAGGLFAVSGSKVISVMADITGAAGETVGVRLTSMNGSAVSVSGNLHTVSAVTTPATVVFGASTTPATNTALDPASDVVGWQNTVTVGQRYVWLKSLQLRVIGSVLPGDLRNYRLFVDGVAVGSAVAAADANGYIVFDLSGSPVKMETGSRVLKVMLDVVGGSGRNFYLSVRQASDIWAVDSQYSSAVLATATAFPVVATNNGVQTVTAGTLTVTKKNDSPSGDVVKDGSGVVLARFEFKAAGERMKVESLRVSNTSVPPFGLRNGALFANGVQVGSTATLWEDTITATNSLGYTQYNLGSSLIVDPGTPVTVEIRADIFDASGTNNVVADSTIIANIVAQTGNVQRLTSLNYTDVSANIGNTLTVKTGSLSGNKYTGYANQSVVVPKTGIKLGHFTLAAASSENVNVNTIDIGFNNVTGFMASKTLDVYLKVWNDTGSLIYTSPVKSTVSAAASSSYSVNFTVPMSKTYQIEVWGNYDTPVCSACAHVSEVEMSATGVAASSGTSSTSTPVRGQTVTTTSGSLTQANGSFPAAQFRSGGTTATGYQFTITPAFDDFYLDEVYVDLSSTLASSSGAVASLMLKEGSTLLGSATVNATTTSASFTGLNLFMPQSSGTRTFTVEVQLSNVGVGANDTGGVVTVRLDGYKYRNSAGSITTAGPGLAPTNGGNANVVVKGYPTFTNVSLPTTVLAAGTMTLFKTSVSATGGQIGWNAITFQVASNSGAIDITNYRLWENGVDITASDENGLASVSFAGTNDRVEFTFATERAISSGNSSTLELRGTVAAAATGNSVSTQITNPNGTTVTTLNEAGQDADDASFVWTDQSAPAHSTATSDWFGDGLVKTLAETQSVSK